MKLIQNNHQSMATMAGTFRCATVHPRHTAIVGGGGKHSHRLLSSLHAVSNDPASADRLIRKFVSSSSKSTALRALSHLLSPASPPSFAISMYRRISEAPWFRWNPKLAASVAALLEKAGRISEAEALISESESRLVGSRDLTLFYCALIESCSQHGLRQRVFNSYAALMDSASASRKVYESMVKGLCLLESPADAEVVLEEMGNRGFKPSAFEFRAVAQAYGRLGRFDQMRRVLETMESRGYELDTICANVVLSCYGDYGEISQMVAWIRKLRFSGVPFSIRTYNSALKSCPAVVSMVGDLEALPPSIDGVVWKLEQSSWADEAELVRELVSGAAEVLAEVAEWCSTEWKLDLHGCHLGPALVVLLIWMGEVGARFRQAEDAPLEISITCGSGKQSSVQGESPVRAMVAKAMIRMKSPLKMDRKNSGRFVAKGKAVKEWLCDSSVVPISYSSHRSWLITTFT